MIKLQYRLFKNRGAGIGPHFNVIVKHGPKEKYVGTMQIAVKPFREMLELFKDGFILQEEKAAFTLKLP